MFVHMKKLPAKTADAFDLALEFATLGEYGLEYPDTADAGPAAHCEQGRRRTEPVPMPAARAADCRQRNHTVECSTRTTDFASALRPPRIKLSFTE